MIRINGVDFNVVEKKDMPIVATGECMGQIDYYEGRILIQEDLNDQIKVLTLFHELVHGILHSSGPSVDHGLTEEQEEEMCEVIAYGLNQIIKDNTFLKLDINELLGRCNHMAKKGGKGGKGGCK
jgi:Zn-dependent peptidase ImmA (M78 family)